MAPAAPFAFFETDCFVREIATQQQAGSNGRL
jgi:hypothetical protein